MITALLILLCLINPALAANASSGAPDTGAMNELLRIFESTSSKWPAIILPVTTWLFWSLVTISWAWGFGEMALKGADIKELIAELFKRTFMVGFFWWLLTSAPEIAAAIVNGFTWIGGKLAGEAATYKSISPSSIFDIGISLVTQILEKLSVTKPVDSLGYVLVGLGILVIFAFITLQLMVLIIQYYVFLNAGVVMLGFLGHEWSREYGINYFKLMIGLGVKYLTMQLIIVLTIDITQGWMKQSDLTWTQLIIILPIMIILWGLIREIPQMAQSLVSGTDQTTGNSIAGALQASAAVAAVAAGAAAGAYAAAGGASGMAQGAGNMSQLLKGAWNEATGVGGGDDSSSENDPATSPPPDSASNDAGGEGGASEGYDSNSGDTGGSDSGGESTRDAGSEETATASDASAQSSTGDPAQSGSPSEASTGSGSSTGSDASGSGASSQGDSGASGGSSDSTPPSNTSSSPAAKKSFAATAALAAGIAGKAIGSELKGSATNAYKAGMDKFKAPFSTPSDSALGKAAQAINPKSAAAAQVAKAALAAKEAQKEKK